MSLVFTLWGTKKEQKKKEKKTWRMFSVIESIAERKQKETNLVYFKSELVWSQPQEEAGLH